MEADIDDVGLEERDAVRAEEDIRSKRVVFIPFCLICQGFQARGIAREYPAVVRPVIDVLLDANVNMIQMPCPESVFGGLPSGIRREPKGIDEYDVPEFRELCGRLADDTAGTISASLSAGFQVIAVLGMERSPSCAVNTQADGSRRPGIFVHALMERLRREGISVPFIGVNKRTPESATRRLMELLDERS